eukprot:CAMPEP_0176416880 /NCGR_PEP_ID=MMETSP0127-20121128/6583_1 /TAXON_ID=938130 /ORGANISM="Platyophrya macrostoma, Strain WH" /LENGTH=731 /DNA_ID=CAMNT_0017796987 /DNA_START=61 /DNA_END=2256 /DNA_ORIENTATION=+
MTATRLDIIEKQLTSSSVSGTGAHVIALDNAPLNALNFTTRKYIIDEVHKANNDPAVRYIVITGNGKAFSAGADIAEFSPAAMKEPYLPEVLDVVENSTKVVLAVVNGMALGGGCELALASHVRLLSSQAVMGLPEIKLGLIPGAGGTQRLPRCVGVKAAIDLVCSGRTIKAQQALAMGLVDEVVPVAAEAPALETQKVMLAAAESYAVKHLKEGKKNRRLCDDTSKLGNCLTNSVTFRLARNHMLSTVPKGVISPFRALDAIIAATSVASFKDGLEAERQIFLECSKTPQAQAMVHFFLAQRAALRIPGATAGESKPATLQSVGIVGGGTMGAGIAICCLNAGLYTVILETSEERKKFARQSITSIYTAGLAKKKLTDVQVAERLGRLTIVVDDFAAFRDVDFVVEAVFESMSLKKEIFAKLDTICKPSCILASNTSTLNVDDIASSTRRPQNVVGAHFFSPANIMPLLELIRGRETSTQTIQTSLQFGKLIKKVPVVVGNCFGFVSNRMILRAGFQAMAMAEEGCFPREVDAVIKSFGFPVGPFAMQDIAGLDVGSKIRKETPAAFLPKRDVTTISEQLVVAKRLGQKTGLGWYRYDPKAPRKPIPDRFVEKLILDVAKQKAITRRMIEKSEIEERYLLALVHEASEILGEGIATRPSDIDLIYIFGFGFPPYKGGPCHWADRMGLANVVRKMTVYHNSLGEATFPAPSSFLKRMVAENLTFEDLNKRV